MFNSMFLQESGYTEHLEEGDIKISTHGFWKEKNIQLSSAIIQLQMSDAVLHVVNEALECATEACDLVESPSR